MNRRSPSPLRWTGVEKSRPSYDDGRDGRDRRSISPSRYSFREGRDDSESRDAASRSETPDEKVRKFDDLLKRIEAERTKVSPYRSSRGVPSTPTYEREVTAPPNMPSSVRGPSSSSFERNASEGNSRSFADRARELRMSVDTPPKRPQMSSLSPTPHERISTRRDDPSPPARERQQASTPSNGQFKLQVVEQFHSNLSTAYDTISSLESEVRALKKQLTERDDSIMSLERRNKTLNETIAVSEEQAKEAEQGNRKLLDTNKELSRLCDEEVRKLTTQCEKHKEKVVALEHRNAALNESVAMSRDQASKAEEESRKMVEENRKLTERYDEHVAELTAECDSFRKHTNEIKQFSAECDATVKDLLKEKRETSKKHADEIEELTSECQKYKKAANQAAEFEFRSVEYDSTIKELKSAKLELQSTVSDKERTISDKERTINDMERKIKRLEDELDDVRLLRSRAAEAEKLAHKLEVQLEASKKEHQGAMKEVLDLELRLEAMRDVMEKSTERVTEKDAQIEKLTSLLSSTENESHMVEEKVERLMNALAETKIENEESTRKTADLEQRLECADAAVVAETKEMNELREKLAKSQSQLEDLKQVLKTKMKRFEKYEKGCSKEQESIAVLEKAIEELVAAHDESSSEIRRLQKENQNLSKDLLAAQKESSVEVVQLRKENSSLLKDREAAHSERNDEITKLLKEKQTLSDSLERAKNESGAEVLELTEEIERLTEDLEAAQANASHEILELQNEIDSLSSTLNEAEEYMKMYMNDMQDAMKLKSQMREMEDINNDLSAQLAGKAAQIQELKDNEEILTESLNALKLSFEEKESESQKDGESEKRRVKELEEKLAGLEKRCAASEDNGNEMVAVLQKKLDSVNIKLKKREEQLESSKAGLANAQNMILKLVKTVEELRKKLKEKETPRADKPQKK
ncbi:hypothetical protein QTG54_001455 [Skeletonema marinoi]|uniref:Uncharacterized protein n=1 Tax=Skeletonema marinoi TaxID=267567 RepID=A0AAD9DHL5_9STRA|nr:hypothetical protein QTG54_001455 [Skeletonema marinoi]